MKFTSYNIMWYLNNSGDENEENFYKNINYGCDTYIDIRNNVF